MTTRIGSAIFFILLSEVLRITEKLRSGSFMLKEQRRLLGVRFRTIVFSNENNKEPHKARSYINFTGKGTLFQVRERNGEILVQEKLELVESNKSIFVFSTKPKRNALQMLFQKGKLFQNKKIHHYLKINYNIKKDLDRSFFFFFF